MRKIFNTLHTYNSQRIITTQAKLTKISTGTKLGTDFQINISNEVLVRVDKKQDQSSTKSVFF